MDGVLLCNSVLDVSVSRFIILNKVTFRKTYRKSEVYSCLAAIERKATFLPAAEGASESGRRCMNTT